MVRAAYFQVDLEISGFFLHFTPQNLHFAPSEYFSRKIRYDIYKIRWMEKDRHQRNGQRRMLMKKRLGKLLGTFLCLSMVLGLMPSQALQVLAVEEPTPNYLTFTAEEAGSTLQFSWYSEDAVEISTNGGADWSAYTKDETITLVQVGDSVKMRGKITRIVPFNIEKGAFTMTGKIAASGSVTSLADENGAEPNVTMPEGGFPCLFWGCTSLTSAPELPAKNLDTQAYQFMFRDCTSLTSAPQLPATTLTWGCYGGMFQGCTSLKQAPELPAMVLQQACYENMFADCSALEQVPNLPATTLADDCYRNMFLNCTGLAINKKAYDKYIIPWGIPKSAVTTNISFWSKDMFKGCSGVDFWNKGTAPDVGETYYQQQPASERHVHCVCGTSGCKLSGNTHRDVAWLPVSDLSAITEAGNYYLTQDIEMKETWEPNAGVVLCLNGHSISNTYKDNLRPNDEKATIQIISGKFTLTDCSRDENGQNKGSVTHANGSRGTGVTFFNTDTSFDMYGGNIRGNYAVDHYPKWTGAGVYVAAPRCHFTMYGGSISDNQGHGVSVVEGATFTMNGGSITNNTISGSSGAGVVNCGKVVMNKGLISKNSITDGDGAGVYNGPAVINANYQKPVFEMRGGEISENTTTTKGSGGGISNLDAICTITSGSICRNQAGNGGGVNNTESVFEMQGGEIIGNRANGYSGGGVNNNTGLATGSFTMSGGVIKENQAAQYGGGVACYEYTTTTGKGVLTISVKNAAVIQDNTLANNKSSNLELRDNVVLTDVRLNGSNQIGISTETAPKTEKPITIANKTGLMNGLFSDHAAYEIAEEDGKTILQMKKYTVKLVLLEDGSVRKISGGDLVQKVNDNFQTVQLQADDDHYFSEENKSAMRQADIYVSSTSGNVSKIMIYVRPTADVEVQILATEKASQKAPENISGIAPIQEGGKGYLQGMSTEMEYREKGTSEWISCQSDSSLGEIVIAGKTYEVRRKGDITKKASPIIEVFVPETENVTPNPKPTPEKPVMKDGDNGQHVIGKTETLTFRSSAPLDQFVAVFVDGIKVDASNYELAEGSTIVRLKQSFLDTLSKGSHTIAIQSLGGTATASFTVAEASNAGSGNGGATGGATGGTTGTGAGSGSGTGTTTSESTEGITNVQPASGTQTAQNTGSAETTTVNVTSPETGDASPVSCIVLAIIIMSGLGLMIVELRRARRMKKNIQS